MAAAVLAGCASTADRNSVTATTEQVECRVVLARFDERVLEAGVADAQAARVDGFPYLRVSRLLSAGFSAQEKLSAFDQWVGALRGHDRAARRIEAANLGADGAPALADVEACAALLMRTELSSNATRTLLVENAVAPDAYVTLNRVLGLYPLTSLPFSFGIAAYHDETRKAFASPLPARPSRGRLTRFGPPDARGDLAAEIPRMLERSSRNALGLPLPTGGDLERLFATYAPAFDVEVASRNDRIGVPVWTPGGLPDVDTARPTVYRLVSHTRFGGEFLLQLNYVAWFAARPKASALDLLGGPLDGITVRVTLGTDGTPLVLETMHNCGCYHMFMPGGRVGLRSLEAKPSEPPLVVQRMPRHAKRVALRIRSGTHYVVRAYAPADQAPQAEVRYAFADYDAIRSLPTGTGRRSLFAPDGLVRGSERAERWLFWPMGVPSAGAMRQWGHHAIAFLGRRHFDDPRLIETFFEPR